MNADKEIKLWHKIILPIIIIILLFGYLHINNVWTIRRHKFILKFMKHPVELLRWSKEYDFNWRDSLTTVMTESEGKQYALNKRTGAKGYMQGIDNTFKEIWKELKLKGSYYGANNNLRAGLFYLYTSLKYWADWDLKLAIEMYCCGVGNYRNKGWRASKHMKRWVVKREVIERKWNKEKWRVF